MYAQFAAVPPLPKISTLFRKCTNRPFEPGVTWEKWMAVESSEFELFRPYIRPCHQQILNEASKGQETPCAFLRQLLRPHGYRIKMLRKNSWTLLKGKEEERGVKLRNGKTIIWADS
jgi:hypothetical protein